MEIDAQTNASPIADDTAEVKRKTAVTKDRMFFGAFVNAYSRPVIDARISLKAMRIYDPDCIQTFSGETSGVPSGDTQVAAAL